MSEPMIQIKVDELWKSAECASLLNLLRADWFVLCSRDMSFGIDYEEFAAVSVKRPARASEC